MSEGRHEPEVDDFSDYDESYIEVEDDLPEFVVRAMVEHPWVVTLHNVFKLIAFLCGLASFVFGIYWLFAHSWWQGLIIIIASPFVVGLMLLLAMVVVAGITKLLPKHRRT